MNDSELERDLREFVLEYASKMNTLECEAVQLDKDEPGQDHFSKYTRKYRRLFKKYCTDKKRSYGGRGGSYGTPPQYDGIEESVDQSTNVKTRSRAEVYFKTQNDSETEYLFVVLKKAGEWKIDGVKYKLYGNEKWAVLHL